MNREDSYPSRLCLSTSGATSVARELFGLPGTEVMSPPALPETAATPEQLAEHLYACEATQPRLHEPLTGEEGEPYTLQWFLDIENQRHGRHARWIPRLLEFSRHPGETLLGLGQGLGTDWIQYARHGATVIVCSSSLSQLGLIRRHFQLRGLEGRFVHAAPTALPLDTASIDVACLNGLLEVVEQPAAVINEVFRVLKPGGKIIAVTTARYDVDYWRDLFFFWERWFRRPAETGPRFSVRGLKQLFHRFSEHRIHRRHLRRSEVPRLWRLIPLPLLERLIGRVLVLKAFKPIAAAMQLQAAA